MLNKYDKVLKSQRNNEKHSLMKKDDNFLKFLDFLLNNLVKILRIKII